MHTKEILAGLRTGQLDSALTSLYGFDAVPEQRARYIAAVSAYKDLYGDADVSVFTVAGRSEIAGNHTDHNLGRVIAASVDLDIIAVAEKTEDGYITVKSEGFDPDRVSVTDDTVDESRFFTSGSIITGVCKGFTDRGYKTGGYRAYTTSNILKGSGLSSSAAYEVMIGNILNHFYNDGKIDNAEIAVIAQYAENVYFGKPCGLMDQTACAVGGFVAIDFADPDHAVIEQPFFDLTGYGYCLCITATGGNHADLNEDYASIPAEMKAVAAHFGQTHLRSVSMEALLSAIPVLREKVGDRAILRAYHYLCENARVVAQTDALDRGDIQTFFALVKASGRSSFEYLQNVYTQKNVSEQGLSLALALTESYMRGRSGAWRVHGGGFAGTIQAYVDYDDVPGYRALMDGVFGEGACRVLHVRSTGAACILK